MLSSSWRRPLTSSSPSSSSSAVMPALASRGSSVCGVPRGTVVLEAQYDYQYRGGDGRQVCIREGERFVLLRKTNGDWWQVKRIGAASKTKPLYVPATYVVEVPIAPLRPPQHRAGTPTPVPEGASRASLAPQDQHTATRTFCRSMENLNSHNAWRGAEPGSSDGQGSHFPSLPLSGSPCPASSFSSHLLVPGGGPGWGASIPRSRSSTSLPQNPYEEQEGGQGGMTISRAPHLRAPQKYYSQWDTADLPRRHSYLQVPGQDYITQKSLVECGLSSELERRQGSQPPGPQPPSPPPGQPPLQTLGLWEQYSDSASGRCFYINSITQERSWKPPRRARQHPPARAGPFQNQNQTLPRPSHHLSLPLPSPGHGTLLRLSPDFLHPGQRNPETGWQSRQSMQRAVSSDTLNTVVHGNTVAHDNGDVQRRHSALLHGENTLSHSLSMILPESQSQGREFSYNGTNIIVEPPSPVSSPDSPDETTPELEKAGLLNKTKIAEGGRKLRKNWSQAWVVLVGNSLVFFKDPKAQTPSSWRPGNSRPESSVDLRGAQLHWANDLSSKKGVFRLRTVTGNEFLLQSDTLSLISEWYTTIQGVLQRLERENPLDNVLLYSLRRAGSVEMLDHSGDEDDSKGVKSPLPRSISSLENTEKKRVKSRLKKLILKRPPLQALQEKGLIKDQVFGCSLEILCEREKSSVPRFVRLCTQAVERRGLETDGIYRVSGNLAVIQKLRFLVNHEEKLNLEDSRWEDIHVVTGALKLFFRELPEPLVPYGFFTDIIETVKMSDYVDKLDRMKCLVLSMPPPTNDTMCFMIRHLQRVMEHSEDNRMTTQNLGIVFGPTLMRPERDSANMAVNMVYQNQAVELILSEANHIFGHSSTL
ncbi:LOW QUALITY PROTEIN: rho GTPase-activating protein 15 [Osmerus mordax]|uniref:LOW QUALITY PROTEIN: rho GTPase-activating protein 15 n=1 Tax=Osmerus mordax TaxID=8014 RepID=UPI00350FD11B